ncbi:hypothetical protein SD70_17975 [Gordoniibacillus kamchatkensis]|uniref:YitT family protein n=2 Tax=Gordoniibacillus kamchatkensis TaxID=1590651 RepID=A0ABR5AFG9_9BACL|nr:hypothetical protein SD70_17975 [Paenibacillus sp. VKM B-2647]
MRLLASRATVFIVGLAIMAYGIVLIVQARFGAAPWDVMHLGIVQLSGLSFGRVRQIVGLAVITVACLMLRQWPTVGLIANMLLVGEFCNWLVALHLVPVATDIPRRIALFTAGLFVWGFGTGVYIQSKLGAGPRDLLMLAIHHRTGWPIRWVRTILEIAAVTAGICLSGPFSIGTIAFSFCIGHTTELGMKVAQRLLRSLTEPD